MSSVSCGWRIEIFSSSLSLRNQPLLLQPVRVCPHTSERVLEASPLIVLHVSELATALRVPSTVTIFLTFLLPFLCTSLFRPPLLLLRAHVISLDPPGDSRKNRHTLKSITLIIFTNSLLPCNVTYPQVPGI